MSRDLPIRTDYDTRAMREPFRTRFTNMIREHAASQDIHDPSTSAGFASTQGFANDAFVRRELERVDTHRRSLLPLLAKVGRARDILDFGCGTGGTTVALATSETLSPRRVIGVDLSRSALAAARVRAAGYGLEPPLLDWRELERGPLPFADGEFDLVVTVSVLEFITGAPERQRVVQDLARVVRPDGHLFIATPRQSIREYHSRRWLGDLRRRPGFPWSSSSRQLLGWLPGWRALPLDDELADVISGTRVGSLARVRAVRGLLPHLTRWHKLLLRRRAAS